MAPVCWTATREGDEDSFFLFIYVEEGTWLRGDCDDRLILPGEDEVVAVLMKGIVIPPTNILL